MNLVPNKQLLLNVPFQSTKYRKKELSVDNKVRETIGDVYCPTRRNEKCVYNSTNKTTSFYDCKKCKACCYVLKIPFNNRHTDNNVVWWWWYTLFCKKGESRLPKEKNNLHFWINFAANQFQANSNPHQTKTKNESKYGMNVSFSYWLKIWATYLYFKPFYRPSIYNQQLKFNQPTYRKSWSSKSQRNEYSGFSILVPHLLLLQ